MIVHTSPLAPPLAPLAESENFKEIKNETPIAITASMKKFLLLSSCCFYSTITFSVSLDTSIFLSLIPSFSNIGLNRFAKPS